MPKTGLSLIIPTLNERDNITELVKRATTALTTAKIPYEFIVIDDHSTDGTQAILAKLAKKYPIRYFSKQSNPGKGASLQEGFEYANYDSIGMIDADLQYPPEEIPRMYNQLLSGEAQIVVADRIHPSNSWVQRLTSKLYVFVFGKLLHQLDCDIQSGLKLFDRAVARRVGRISSFAWGFDLLFLLKARAAGYRVSCVEVPYSYRRAGRNKTNPLFTPFELIWSSITARFNTFWVIPFLPEVIEREGIGFHFQGKKVVPHTHLNWRDSALIQLTAMQKAALAALVLLLGWGIAANWRETIIILIGGLSVYYLVDLLFNLFLVLRSFFTNPEISISADQLQEQPDREWPVYVILCPLYKEWNILPQFMAAIKNMDYPKDKLKAVLLLEEDDTETIAKAQTEHLPSYFHVLVVPESMPKTKPKALNYAMGKVTGEYAVIYDAEDIPQPDQLKKAVIAFETSPPEIICVQAKLNFYNSTQNIMTRLFSLEYSLWFDLILPGLQSINAPIPLGGTSNHFRVGDLRKLKGWDPFNVTEDADLGMRIYKQGNRTAILDSTTMEEANSELLNWFRQRSRWMKGYMQTYLVHMRGKTGFMWNAADPHALTFHLMIGGKVIACLINPLLWLMTISYFLFRATVGPTIESFFPTSVFYIAIISLFIGNFLYMYYYMMGAVKRQQWNLLLISLLAPLYWLGMSLATTYGLIELLRRPHHWHKTKHGLHIPAIPVKPALATIQSHHR